MDGQASVCRSLVSVKVVLYKNEGDKSGVRSFLNRLPSVVPMLT